MKCKKCSALLLAALLAGSLTACGAATAELTSDADASAAQQTIDQAFANGFGSGETDGESGDQTAATADAVAYTTADSQWFTDRDLDQTPDLSRATAYTVKDGQDITITQAGTYVLSGTASDATIIVDAGDEDKVQLVLDGLTITNEDAPCIYGKNADKIFVTTLGENSLSVTGAFTADGETNTDAVIFSRDDLVLNGTGSLTISSTDNGITSKDDLKVTGGTLTIDCVSDGLEANESIAVAAGTVTITADKDGLHAENDEDDTAGAIYIQGGTFAIDAGSDAIQGTTTVQIAGGTFDLTAAEGIEGTYVLVSGGTVSIQASDDGINAAAKSTAVEVKVEITGGDLTIAMGQGDTDAIDSNGDVVISGGTVDITASSPFDYDGTGSLTGGTLIVNGQETTQLTNQMMGGGRMGGQMFGGRGGQMPGGGQEDQTGGQGQTGQRPAWGGQTDADTGATPEYPREWGQRPQDRESGQIQGWEDYDQWGQVPDGGDAPWSYDDWEEADIGLF